jgi:hypothetical protein
LLVVLRVRLLLLVGLLLLVVVVLLLVCLLPSIQLLCLLLLWVRCRVGLAVGVCRRRLSVW